MLVIRMQRAGKTHYATYRVVVQDVRSTPSSGKVIAYLGSYNPHTKEAKIDKTAAEKFLANGAHPSPRAVRVLTSEGLAMPKWVKGLPKDKKRAIRNPEKLRKNQPKAEPESELADNA